MVEEFFDSVFQILFRRIAVSLQQDVPCELLDVGRVIVYGAADLFGKFCCNEFPL